MIKVCKVRKRAELPIFSLDSLDSLDSFNSPVSLEEACSHARSACVYSVAQKWLSEMSIHNSYPSSRDLNMSSTVGVTIPEAGFALPADASRFVVLLIARAKQGRIPNQAAMLSLPAWIWAVFCTCRLSACLGVEGTSWSVQVVQLCNGNSNSLIKGPGNPTC